MSPHALFHEAIEAHFGRTVGGRGKGSRSNFRLTITKEIRCRVFEMAKAVAGMANVRSVEPPPEIKSFQYFIVWHKYPRISAILDVNRPLPTNGLPSMNEAPVDRLRASPACLGRQFSKASRAHGHTRGKHIDGQPLISRFFPMIGGVRRRGVSRLVAIRLV